MKLQGPTLKFGLFVAGLAALTMLPPEFLMAQVMTPAGRADFPTYPPETPDMTRRNAVWVAPPTTVSDTDFALPDASAALPPVSGLTNPGAPAAINSLQGGNLRVQQKKVVSTSVLDLIGVLTAGNAFGAQRGRGPAVPNPAPTEQGQAGGGGGRGRGDVAIVIAQPGAAWWTNAALVARLGLTDDQKKKIEATFEQYRQTLVQNRAVLEKEEAALARMLEAEPMEPVRLVSAQIERVVQARGEMERTNSKMTLEIRQSLTRSQWVQLQSETLQPATTPATNPPGGRGGARSGGAGQRSGGPAPPPVGTPTP